MCLWLLTACLGLLPGNPAPIVVVPAVPAPIVVPTTVATTTTAAAMITAAPTVAPTMPPTVAPTMPPTVAPTMPPTVAPTMPPTVAPTMPPTVAPTMPPTVAPTMPPTVAPTMPPTVAPTMPPTVAPTMPPTVAPTMPPTVAPTVAPTMAPTVAPTVAPTAAPNTGSLAIDPRLATTPAALRLPPITGYSAQLPSYDNAVRFPREKRNVDSTFDPVIRLISEKHQIRKRQACQCVPTGTCVKPTTNYGAGMLDVRIVTPTTQCPTGQEYCCTGTTTTAVACGTLQTVPSTGVTPTGGQANFGEFPWQALILTKQNDYLAGGVLIDSLNVITVTHRLVNYVVSGTAPNVKVRLGEWDAGATYEPVPFQEYTVKKVFTHPSYNPNTLQYDITVLRLSSAVPFTPTAGSVNTINRACLPPSATTVYTGQRCMVAGWGKNMFGLQGQYQQILKRVDVPIVAPATCQTQMQTARLGATFVLDTTSFICAGGEANKDSCTGDGGSGLVCQVNGQWVVVGLVSWGLGCANANVPAAYVNVAGLLPWIQQQVAAAA